MSLCEFGVTIYSQIQAWPPGVYYWSQDLAFGAISASTVEQAEAQGWEAIRKGRQDRAQRFTVQHFCHHCRTSGIEPGFKRKKCSQCVGLGVCEVP